MYFHSLLYTRGFYCRDVRDIRNRVRSRAAPLLPCVAEVRDLPKISSLFRTKVALYMDIGKVCSYTHRAKAKAESAFCSTNTSISI